jgi:hypothetical protein
LKTVPPNTRLAKFAEKMGPKKVLKKITDVNVVVPGQVCRGNKCISPEKMAELQSRIQALKAELNKIDVVFLIDGTKSMTRYFAPVAKGVQAFINSLDSPEEISLSIAAAIYGDYRNDDTGAESVQYIRLLPRHDPLAESEFLERMATLRRVRMRDPWRDPLQAPFAAILRMLKDRTSWRGHNGFKYLVHIAAHGNRRPGEGKNALTRGHDETVDIADVVRALRKKGVIYVPIVVVSDGLGKASERMRRQAQEIGAALEKNGLYRSLRTVRGEKETASEIEKFLRQAIAIRATAFKKIQQMRACNNFGRKACIKAILHSTDGSFSVTLSSAAIKRLGLDTAMAEISGYVQRTMPVWVPPFQDGEQVLDFWWMTELRQLHKLSNMTGHLCRKFVPGKLTQAEKILKEALIDAAEIASGEDEEEAETAADALRKQLFIPGWALSEIFGKKWGKLREYIDKRLKDDPDLVKKMNKHFCKKWYFLENAINRDRRIIDEGLVECDFDDGKNRHVCTTSPENIKKFQWYYDFGNGQVFYFIPIRYLP